jgi:hypothetical protein
LTRQGRKKRRNLHIKPQRIPRHPSILNFKRITKIKKRTLIHLPFGRRKRK